MASDEVPITLERGNFDWSIGRGYEAPAEGGAPLGGGELPPGWNDVPDFIPRSVRATRPEEHREPAPASAPSPPAPTAQPVRQWSGDTSGDFVDLESGDASYKGHELSLSDEAVSAIQVILASEVCAKLEAEKERILAGVQLTPLLERLSGGQPNVSEVQGPPTTMDAPETSGS